MPPQYPHGTTNIWDYIESRGGLYDATLFCGIQAYLKEYLSIPVTKEMVDFSEVFWKAHGVRYDRTQWDYVVDHHGGLLPLEIRALPEGTVLKTLNILVSVVNTDEKCKWATTWIEKSLLRAVWYATSVATVSYNIKKDIARFLRDTSDAGMMDLRYMLHDFGGRGVSSFESAGLGSMAHGLCFGGTDTPEGILASMEYYNSDVASHSLWGAMEHSTVTSWGRENERLSYENMIDEFAVPNGKFAMLIDSYDVFHAARVIIGEELRQKIIDCGAQVILRPDSGDPVTVMLELLEILGEKFGYDVNSKGYKMLRTVSLIQGDGVCHDTLLKMLQAIKDAGWATLNVSYGMGGALLQIPDRDMQKFAMKCSAIKVNGEWRDVHKDPITDQGKRSKAGRLDLVKGWDDTAHDNYFTDVIGDEPHPNSLLRTVWRNGELLVDDDYKVLRNRAGWNDSIEDFITR